MLDVKNNTLIFSFSDLHAEAHVGIEFQRTLRIPDDDKEYHLPPGLGKFPIRKVSDLPADKVPDSWKENGGVVIPMFQSEAMWINFKPNHPYGRGKAFPFAVKIATGNVSALTGNKYVEELSPGNYLVVPEQPWLDGFAIDDGLIRQFVASPLGSGVSVEQQMTGEDKVGGLQIEIIPMKGDVYNQKYPERSSSSFGMLRSTSLSKNAGYQEYGASTVDFMDMMPVAVVGAAAASDDDVDYSYERGVTKVSEMSLAGGGKMKQQIFNDPFEMDAWDINSNERCFIHLVNSETWEFLTGESPPSTPLNAATYNRYGMPWFDYYAEKPSLKPNDQMRNLKSIKDMPGGEEVIPPTETLVEESVINLGLADTHVST